MADQINSFEELRVYREEKYSLTDQIRRLSRSVGANISEAWQKRRYKLHFLSKLSDADAELAETLHHISTTRACEYIDDAACAELRTANARIGSMIGRMIDEPHKWTLKQSQ